MASCAACLQPILRAQRFLLDGTEVFHAQCVGQAYRSKLRLAEQRGWDLERQLNDTRRAAARVESEANRHRNDAMTAQARAVVLEGRIAGLLHERELSAARLDAHLEELRAARNEVAALRRELAALRPSESESERADADLDATAQRFRMLELD